VSNARSRRQPEQETSRVSPEPSEQAPPPTGLLGAFQRLLDALSWICVLALLWQLF